MQYLHTMIRVTNLEKSLHFYTQGLGFDVVRKNEYPDGKFTLVFLRAPGDAGAGASAPMIELTHNWGVDKYERGDAYGHCAYRVDSMEKVQARLKQHGYDLSWGPGKTPDGRGGMAFVDDPDGYEIELLER
ncbi:MAG: lactoylglutathione lyase [Deltaproteobacteria bacterium]|nr:lactoylglutathione lyase [Deltaproteobacteria bacterium]